VDPESGSITLLAGSYSSADGDNYDAISIASKGDVDHISSREE